MSNQRKKVGAGWARTSQDGTKKYVSIVIHGGLAPDINLVMFKNGFKEEENQPDFILYLNPPKDPAGQPAEKPATKPAAAAADFPGDEAGGEPAAGDDGIPF